MSLLRLLHVASLTFWLVAIVSGDLRAEDEAPAVRTDRYGDPLPPGAIARLGTVRFRHEDRVDAVAFSPCGRMVASASWDRTVRLWDVSTGKEVRRLTGHEYRVYSVAFSPDGKVLAAGSDKTVRAWDVGTGRQLHVLEAGEQAVVTVAFTPDGKKLAAGNGEKAIQVWDVVSGKGKLRWLAHRDTVRAVVFFPDGKTIASTGWRDETICLWDADSGKEVKRWKGHPNWINALTCAPDGATLASASDDKTIGVWDAVTGKEVRRLTGHRERVTTVAFSPDGKTLASASWDRTIRLWEATTGKEMARLSTGTWSANSVCFSPDGKTLAAGTDDYMVRLWDLATGKEIHELPAHRGRVETVAFFPDGKTLASGGMDGAIRLWDAATGKELDRLTQHTHSIDTLSISGDGKTLASASNDRTIRLWDVSARKEIHRTGQQERWPRFVGFAPDGKSLASAHEDGKVYLWDAGSAKQLRQWQRGKAGGVDTAAFAPDGKTIAAPGDMGLIHFWDTATGKPVRTLKGTHWSHGLAFSPDSTILASSLETSIELWRLTPNREARHLSGHRNRVVAIAFATDGRLLASGSQSWRHDWNREERGLRLWEVASGAEVRHWEGHPGQVLALAFAPDGRSVAVAGEDGTILIWDVAGWGRDARGEFRKVGERDLPALWNDLASADATTAFRAVCAFVSAPQHAVAFLQQRVPPAPAVDRKRLDKWIANLDSNQFMVRTEATEELHKLAEIAERALMKTLDGKPALEVQRRIEPLLEKVKERELSPEWLRQVRAVQALEYIGTAEATEVLRALAGGAPESWLTQQAQGALERSKRRAEMR